MPVGNYWVDGSGGGTPLSAANLNAREFVYIVPPPTGVAATDTAAIQAQLTAAGVAGGLVQLHPGTYATNATLNFGQKVTMRGAGPLGTTINYSGSSYAILFGSGTLAGAHDTDWTRLGLYDLAITGTASGLAGVRVRGATRWEIGNITATGFTGSGAAGILLNGASFIGHIRASRLKGNNIGLSAQKVSGDGAAGEGQAFNAITVSGQCEIQNNVYGVLIGNTTTTETAPVVGMGSVIQGCCIEGNSTGGIWNVGGNSLTIRDNYFEGNTSWDIRVGSAAGNTSIPVVTNVTGNFIYTTALGVDLVRALHPRVRDNYFLADAADTTTGIQIAAANVSGESITDNFPNTIDTPISDLRSTPIAAAFKHGAVGPASEPGISFRHDDAVNLYASNSTTLRSDDNLTVGGDLTARPSDVGQTSQGRAGPSNEAGMLLGTSADTGYYRAGAGHLAVKDAIVLPNAVASASVPINTIFRDSSDNLLKQKNNGGTVSTLGGTGGGSGAAEVIPGGTLSGASSSQDLSGKPRVLYTATVAANHALTFNNTPTGAHVTLALTQDATGGRTFSVNGTAIDVDQAASAVSIVEVFFDGTDYFVMDLDPTVYANPRPSGNNLKAWTCDPAITSASQAPTAGLVWYARIPWPKTDTITTIHAYIGTASGTGNANTFFGLYNAAGTLIAKTADQSTAVRTGGQYSATLTAEAGQSLTNVPGGIGKYLVGAFIQGTASGTALQLRSGGTGSANMGLAASNYRSFTRGTGLTALPATVDFTTSTTLAVMLALGLS